MRKLKLSELGRSSVEEYRASSKLPVTVILDSIRSAHNVGSIFRTSDAMAIQQLVLCGITAKPPHKEINKTAIGATNSVEWSYEEDIVQVVSKAKKEGQLIIGIEQTNKSVALQDYEFNSGQSLVIIVGNEVDGISEGILPLLDIALEVPQFGTKHSLNVAVCTGIILWTIRQAHLKQ